MNIRPMQAKDRSMVIDLIHATGIFAEEEERVAAELIDVYLSQPNQKDYAIDVVESEGGLVMGYVCYGPAPMTEGSWDVYWIAVHPGRHKQGYGKALLNEVEKKAREQKGRLIVIETSSQDKYASTRHFYEKQGFVENGRVRNFYRPGDDRVIYCKYL